MKFKKNTFLLLLMGMIFGYSSLGLSLDKERGNLIYQQWETSAHAQSMSTPEERERMNKTGCAHCHTAQGYWEVILAGKKSTAPYEDPTGITCQACHVYDNGSGEIRGLKAGNVKNACTGCHNILVQNDTKGFSSCPQGSIVKGAGGEEFEQKIYPSGKHSRIIRNCAGCHMALLPARDLINKVGGHTFRVLTKGKSPRILNNRGCLKCHRNMNLTVIEKFQKKIKILLDTLSSYLPQREIVEDKMVSKKPRFPRDPSLNKIEAMAAFNYYQVEKDGTFGVHNPPYIKKLLKDSIEALKKLKQNPDKDNL